MNSKKRSKGGSPKADNKQRMAHEAEGGASGALAGAVLGAGAGPPGIVAGALIGGLAGALTGAALDRESARQSARTRLLDAQIGVSKGDLGAPNLKHPPARRGAYSAASLGVDSSSHDESAEGADASPGRVTLTARATRVDLLEAPVILRPESDCARIGKLTGIEIRTDCSWLHQHHTKSHANPV